MTEISKNDEIDSTGDPLKLLLEAKKDELSTPITTEIGLPGHEAKAHNSARKIASNYPEGAESVIDDVAALLDSKAKKTRNNAIGLLGDLAQSHPELVVKHTEAIADRLDDDNIQARVNASLALLETGGADPSAIRDVSSKIVDALDDASPAVRANACTLIGNAGIEVDVETLRDLSKDDPNEQVREQASWALSRLK